MSRRIIGAVLAVVLAAAGTFVLVLYVRGAEERALAGEETVDVLVVSDPVPPGTQVSDLGGSVRTERIPMKVQAHGSLASLDDLDGHEGQVTAVELLPGEQITTARLVEPGGTRAQVDVPDGLLEVTVALAPERVLGGQLQPGNHVGVLASFDPFDLEGSTLEGEEPEEGAEVEEGRTPNTTHLIVHKVLVTNVQADQAPAEDEDANAPPSGNLLVTLALDAPSVEQVVFTAEFGRLWLALEPEDAPEEGTRIQQRGTIYR